jgi:hypothetical protein
MKANIFLILVLLIINLNHSFSQNWERWYAKENCNVESRSVYEHYDKGYILSGIIWAPDYIHNTSWIIKTDINGDTLWSKILLGGESLFVYSSSTTQDGGLLLCGTYSSETGKNMPFATKLNACGEKEWCLRLDINEPGPFSVDILETSSGDIGLLVFSGGWVERVYLYKLNPNGEVLFLAKPVSKANYPDGENAVPYSLTIDNQDNFYISGGIYWRMINYPTIMKHTGFVSKVNISGNEEWLYVYGIDNDTLLGQINSISKYNDDEYIAVGSFWTAENVRLGLIVKLDEFGNELSQNIIHPSQIQEEYTNAIFYNREILNGLNYIKSAAGIQETGFPASVFSTSFDLFGENFEVFNEIQYPTCSPSFSFLEKTFDDKLLNGLTDEEGDDRMYLTKLNENLEQDSIYTEPYEYDYECDHPIESGFITFNNCNIIVGTEDIPSPKEYLEQKQRVLIQFAPNPALEEIKLSFENTENQNQLDLRITSILGQQVYKTTLIKGQEELSIQLNKWQQGVYLVQVYSNGKLVGSNRFIKM